MSKYKKKMKICYPLYPLSKIIISEMAFITSKGFSCNRPLVQIPQCTSPVSYSAPFCNRNVHICAHFCYRLLHCGIFVWCIMGFVRWVYCAIHDEKLYLLRQLLSSLPVYFYTVQCVGYILSIFLSGLPFPCFTAVLAASATGQFSTKWLYVLPRPILQIIFHKLSIFDRDIILVLAILYWMYRYKLMRMPWQLCCHGMCKIL